MALLREGGNKTGQRHTDKAHNGEHRPRSLAWTVPYAEPKPKNKTEDGRNDQGVNLSEIGKGLVIGIECQEREPHEPRNGEQQPVFEQQRWARAGSEQ